MAGGPATKRAGRYPHDREGSDSREGMAYAPWVAHYRPGPTLGRRRASGRAAAGSGGGAPGQDDDSRVRMERSDGQPVDGSDRQPLGSAADTRRFQRRCRGGSGTGNGHTPPRDRRRRLNSHAGRILRTLWPQADVWRCSCSSAFAGRDPMASGAHHPHGRRRMHHARRHCTTRPS